MAIGAVATVILSVDKFWVHGLSSGTDIGLEVVEHEVPGRDTVEYQKSSKDIRCYFRFKTKGDTIPFEARVIDPQNTRLVYRLVVSTDSTSGKRSEGRDSWYLVYDSLSKDTADPKFDWPSGHRLIINRVRPTGAVLTGSEWIVNLQDVADDSSDDARNRATYLILLMVAVVVMVISVVVTVVSQLRKQAERFIFDGFLEQVILSIKQDAVPRGPDGKPIVKIEIVQRILRMQYLEGNKSETVRDALSLRGPRGYQKFVSAQKLFRDRLEYFAGEISHVLKKTESRRGK